MACTPGLASTSYKLPSITSPLRRHRAHRDVRYFSSTSQRAAHLRDHYETLGVPSTATKAQIKARVIVIVFMKAAVPYKLVTDKLLSSESFLLVALNDLLTDYLA